MDRSARAVSFARVEQQLNDITYCHFCDKKNAFFAVSNAHMYGRVGTRGHLRIMISFKQHGFMKLKGRDTFIMMLQ